MRQTSSLELSLIKPHWLKRGLQIFEGDLKVGNIDYTKTFKVDAVATILNQEWKISQPGFWKSMIEFNGSEQPFSKVKIHPGFSGKIEWKSSDGKQYVFRKIKWWKNTWAWFDRKDKPVIEIRPDYSLTNKQASITVHDTDLPEYRLMTLIGIIIFTLQKARAASAAG